MNRKMGGEQANAKKIQSRNRGAARLSSRSAAWALSYNTRTLQLNRRRND